MCISPQPQFFLQKKYQMLGRLIRGLWGAEPKGKGKQVRAGFTKDKVISPETQRVLAWPALSLKLCSLISSPKSVIAA